MSNFVGRNKPDWDELEDLLNRHRKSRRKLPLADLLRIDVLYRRTTLHLIQVATRSRDPGLLRYLNSLSAAAHSVIYVRPRQFAYMTVWHFIQRGFPVSLARTWRFHAASALILLAGFLLAFFASSSDPLAMYALLPPGDSRMPGSSAEKLQEALRSGRDQQGGEKFAFASFLFSHNLQVGLLSMALGVLAAVPTIFLIGYNGMILGAFAALHHQNGIAVEMWAWILPHGITELLAIVFCGGIGLMLGRAVVCPGNLTRMESLARTGFEAVYIALGAAGMLIFAAFVESYVRQSHLSTATRFAFAGTTAVFWMAYLGRGLYLQARQVRPLPEPSLMTNPSSPVENGRLAQ